MRRNSGLRICETQKELSLLQGTALTKYLTLKLYVEVYLNSFFGIYQLLYNTCDNDRNRNTN